MLDIEGLDVEPDQSEDAEEPEAEPEESAVDIQQPSTGVYSSAVDEPPAGTEPITRSTDVATDELVVSYVANRWRDAVVVSRDIGSVLVRYSRSGPFGHDVRQRVRTALVRRFT